MTDVNFFGLPIEPNEIVELLQKKLQLKALYQQILYQRIIEQAAREHGLVITSEEIQNEAERLYSQRSLEERSDRSAWLADQMISRDTWKAGIRDCLLAKKLSEYLFATQAAIFFEQNRSDFEQVLLYQIVVPSAEIARDILYQLEEREISFYEAAHLFDINEKCRYLCGYEGRLYRSNFKPDIAEVIFNATQGQVIGPLQTEVGHHIVLVEEFISSELTPQRYQHILNQMFQQWLAMELNYILRPDTR